MKLAEIREYEGPNLFFPEPAFKVEFVVEDGDDLVEIARRIGTLAEVDLIEALSREVKELHRLAHLSDPRITSEWLETPGHLAVTFSFDHRRRARAIAQQLAESIVEGAPAALSGSIDVSKFVFDLTEEDAPTWVTDQQRQMRTVGITGTNGKTTTTRLLAHLLMETGLHVGWSSSSGVYIDGHEVIAGDYSGPAGARRVLNEPGVDVAVLETARGGILLKGLAYQSNDVSIFTNVSADHLDLQGIHTVEGLARTKSTVTRVTRPDGMVILNAADPLVMATREQVQAPVTLFCRDPHHPNIADHAYKGGRSLVVQEGWITVLDGELANPIVPIADVPVTLDGRAPHMVENALCAAAAALALGLSIEEVAAGLRSFHNTAEHNLGRLNRFDCGGSIFIMDFAHNEAGLEHLLALGRTYVEPGGRLICIIGTAGDRTDQSLEGLGRIASQQSDYGIAKSTDHYLRGRTRDDLIERYEAGLKSNPGYQYEITESELTAIERALEIARPGDVVVAMVQEFIPQVHEMLSTRGTAIP